MARQIAFDSARELPYEPPRATVREGIAFEVSVICCRARPSTLEREVLRGSITADEERRRARFVRDEDADRFLVGRGTLRREVSRWLAIAPRDVPLELGAHGKPLVVSGAPHVNVSHSGDVVLVAVTGGAPLGVDVEQIDERRIEPGVRRAAFTARENRDLDALPSPLQLDAFFHTWTSREAVMKAVGWGFKLPRESFDVSVDPRIPPALVGSRMPGLVARPLTLVALPVAGQHVATLAVMAESSRIRVSVDCRCQ